MPMHNLPIKDIFISYGRKESLVFATKLFTRLEEAGYSAWFDHVNIPKGDDFQQRIDNGIEMAHNFVFIIAPHAVASAFCRKEIEHAITFGKRIIPILHVEMPVDDMHPIIRETNWIYARETADAGRPLAEWEPVDAFETAFNELIELINVDRGHVRLHTTLLNQALQWDRRHRTTEELLVGEERLAAEKWLLTDFVPPHQPPCMPCDLVAEYICESKKNAENLMTDVFLSAAVEDRAFRDDIARRLHRKGITTWSHSYDIKSGQRYERAIEEGIEQADNLIIFLSRTAMASDYCHREVTHARKYNKRIIPLLIEPVAESEFPPEIHGLQYIDFTDNMAPVSDRTGKSDYETDIDNLLKELATNRDYYRKHKIFLVQAIKWARQDRNASILLRGYNLQNAQAWLKLGQKSEAHPPTALHAEFIAESAAKSGQLHTDVFIAYSRKDSDFARKLNDELQIYGKTTWFDLESIAEGADFLQEIKNGIATADNILFILSPDAVASRYCRDEVEFAARLNKRFVPIQYRQTESEQIPPVVAAVQWTDFQAQETTFEQAFRQLIRTLDTDREHVTYHTNLSQKALEWNQNQRTDDNILRGHEYMVAEKWLETTQSEQKQPPPTKLQTDFILASRKYAHKLEHARKRNKFLSGIGLVFSLIVTVLAVWQWNTSDTQLDAVAAHSLIVGSKLALENEDHATAFRLAERAYIKSLPEPTREATFQLRDVLEKSRELPDSLKYPGLTLPWTGFNLQRMEYEENGLIMVQTDAGLSLWDPNGEQLNFPVDYTPTVTASTLSPDGALLLTTDDNHDFRAWNIRDRQIRPNWLQLEPFILATFTDDGQLVATINDRHEVNIWRVNGEKESHFALPGVDQYYWPEAVEDSTFNYRTLNFSLDGRFVYLLRDYELYWFDRKTGDVHTESSILWAHFSPDNKRLVVVFPTGVEERNNLAPEIWEFAAPDTTLADDLVSRFKSYFKPVPATPRDSPETYRRLPLKGHFDQVNLAMFSADGNYLVTSGNDDSAILWNTDGSQVIKLMGHTDDVIMALFSGDSQFILTLSNDYTSRLWDISGTLRDVFPLPDLIQYISFTDELDHIAFAGSEKIFVYPLHLSPLRWIERKFNELVIDADYLPRYGVEIEKLDEILSNIRLTQKVMRYVEVILILVNLAFLLFAIGHQFHHEYRRQNIIAPWLYGSLYLVAGLMMLYLYYSQRTLSYKNTMLMILSLVSVAVSFVYGLKYYDHTRYRNRSLTIFALLFGIAVYHISPYLNAEAFGQYRQYFYYVGLGALAILIVYLLIVAALINRQKNRTKIFHGLAFIPMVIIMTGLWFCIGTGIDLPNPHEVPVVVMGAVLLLSGISIIPWLGGQIMEFYRLRRRMQMGVYTLLYVFLGLILLLLVFGDDPELSGLSVVLIGLTAVFVSLMVWLPRYRRYRLGLTLKIGLLLAAIGYYFINRVAMGLLICLLFSTLLLMLHYSFKFFYQRRYAYFLALLLLPVGLAVISLKQPLLMYAGSLFVPTIVMMLDTPFRHKQTAAAEACE